IRDKLVTGVQTCALPISDKLAACNQSVDDVSNTSDGEPTVDPGFSPPVQVDRDEVHTTVFPWVAAGGAAGRVAVAYYGTASDFRSEERRVGKEGRVGMSA